MQTMIPLARGSSLGGTIGTPSPRSAGRTACRSGSKPRSSGLALDQALGPERSDEKPVIPVPAKAVSLPPTVGILEALLGVRPETEYGPAQNQAGAPRTVLLVEDNPGDIRLVREAVSTCSIPLRLRIVRDGLEALTLLQHADARPDIILLDLNLPGLDGRAVLRRIKNDPSLLRIPVIVLTGSGARPDIRDAYDLHANCYLVK